MAEELVVVDQPADGVRRLTLNRPAKRNALDDATIDQLLGALQAAVDDAGVRVMVIRGAGKSFCAGGDLTPAQAGARRSPVDDREHMLQARAGRFLEFWEAPFPVVAQVHGHCIGTAVALCNCLDLVVVADDAVIGWPLPLGGGLTGPSLVHLVGARRAKELSFVPATRISGREAAEFGWANRAVPVAELEGAVVQMASRIARTPRGVLQVKKAAINAASARQGFRDAVRDGPTYNALAHTDPEVDAVRERLRRDGVKEATAYFQR